MIEKGNPNSLSDAGVGAACLLTAMQGAWMNVLINAQGLEDKVWATDITQRAEQLIKEGRSACNAMVAEVEKRLRDLLAYLQHLIRRTSNLQGLQTELNETPPQSQLCSHKK